MSANGGTKAVVAALSANLGIAVTKFIAWGLTGAASMLAEAIHSVADSGNQVLLLVGGRRSRRAATAEHPFGYGRERYIYAFIVSIILFSLGGLFALYEAWHKFEEVRAGEPNALLESGWWWVPLLVLGAAMVMEGLSFRTAVRESNPLRGRQSWVRFIRSAKAPELPVILLEDSGALIGLALALLGIGLTLLTDNGIFDVIGTTCIGVLLVVIAVVLAIETKSLLLGEGASSRDVRRIESALIGEGVERVIHLKSLYLGPDELLVAAKIAIDRTDSAVEVAAAIDAAERRVREAVPLARAVYLEPDVFRADYEPAPRPPVPEPPGH